MFSRAASTISPSWLLHGKHFASFAVASSQKAQPTETFATEDGVNHGLPRSRRAVRRSHLAHTRQRGRRDVLRTDWTSEGSGRLERSVSGSPPASPVEPLRGCLPRTADHDRSRRDRHPGRRQDRRHAARSIPATGQPAASSATSPAASTDCSRTRQRQLDFHGSIARTGDGRRHRPQARCQSSAISERDVRRPPRASRCRLRTRIDERLGLLRTPAAGRWHSSRHAGGTQPGS